MRKLLNILFLFFPVFLFAQEMEVPLFSNPVLMETTPPKSSRLLKAGNIYPIRVAKKNLIDTTTFSISDTTKKSYSIRTVKSFYSTADTTISLEVYANGGHINNHYKHLSGNQIQFTKNITVRQIYIHDHLYDSISESIIDTIFNLPDTAKKTDTIVKTTVKGDLRILDSTIVRVGPNDTTINTSIQIFRQSLFPTEVIVISDTSAFFDDFSFSSIYPNQNLWETKQTYINNNFGKNPISIGVATFDALDENGRLYNKNASSFPADTLRSKSFRFQKKDSVMLSFYVQAAGYASVPPRKQDSLVLQFFSPKLNNYVTVWDTMGNDTTWDNFKLISVPIKDTMFLTNGFKFRFINYAHYGAVLSSPGGRSNGDIWNVDYIYLATKRLLSDTVFNDVAIVEPARLKLAHYEAIPYSHLKNDKVYANEVTNNVSLALRNLSNEDQIGVDFNYQLSSGFNLLFEPRLLKMARKEFKLYANAPLDAFPPKTAEDTTSFLIKTYLIDRGAKEFTNVNDTAFFRQKFYNYYAYDDGSAEGGYSLSGLGSTGAMLAYQFTTQIADTLRAIDIFFNRQVPTVPPGETFFTLKVWADMGGKPGNEIYSMPESDTITDFQRKPSFNSGFNNFYHYFIYNDPAKPLIVNGTFYIGFEQVSDKPMNIGLDKNRVSTSKIFYNIDGLSWEPSEVNGSLMMRPVMGKFFERAATVIPTNASFLLYPNPVSSNLQISVPDEYATSILHYSIFDLYGRTVLSIDSAYPSLDVSALGEGMYILQISEKGTSVYTGKFTVIHY